MIAKAKGKAAASNLMARPEFELFDGGYGDSRILGGSCARCPWDVESYLGPRLATELRSATQCCS